MIDEGDFPMCDDENRDINSPKEVKHRPKRWQCKECNKEYCFLKNATKHMVRTGHKKFRDIKDYNFKW